MNSETKRLLLFISLCFLLLGLVPALGYVTGMSLDFGAAGKRASEATGIAWTSNVLVVFRLAQHEPSLWLLVLGSAVPTIAGLIAASAGGRAALGGLLLRILPIGDRSDIRGALWSYALLFISIPFCLLATYSLRTALPGPNYEPNPSDFGSWLFLGVLLFAFLDQGGVLEELGWRGYLQNQMQQPLNPLVTALIVGTVWGLWHVPRDVVGGVLARLGLVEYSLLYLPSFLLGTISVSIVAAYFANRAGGSVIPAVLVHGLSNDAMGLSGLADMAVALTPYHQLTKALPMLVLALAFAATTKGQLGCRLACRE